MERRMAEPLHASAFAYAGIGCLVLGEGGSGKSRVVAEAMALGAKLIADDCVMLEATPLHPIARAVPGLAGVLELRGLGLVRVRDAIEAHPIHLALRLDAAADPHRTEDAWFEAAGHRLKLRHVPPPPQLSVSALLLYLQAMQDGRILPADWHPLE
jgi:HPr kinase/phosphorylase